MNKNKRIIIGIIVVAVIFVTAFVVWQAYRKPIITIEPPEGVSPSHGTPLREEWPAMIEKISIWKNGKERIIEKILLCENGCVPENSSLIKI